MVTKTMMVDRECPKGHKWKQEMTVQEFRHHILRTHNYYYGCEHCYYEGVNKVANDLLEQFLNNENH